MSGSETAGGFSVAYIRGIIRFRWLVIVAALLLFLACLSGARYVEFDDNYRAFFSEDNPHLQAMEQLEETYSKEENILFLLAPEGGDVFDPRVLHAVEELSEDAWQIAYCSRVDSITNFQNSYADGDDIVVEDMVSDPLDLSPAELVAIRETVLSEPLLVDKVVSGKGHVTVVNVTLELPGIQGGERTQPIADARELADTFHERYPDIKVVLVGGTVTSIAFTEYTFQDLKTLTPLMYLIVFTLIAITLRSVAATLASIVVIVLSVGTALGMAGWTGLHFTATTSAMPTIVMTLAVADSIHVLVIMLSEMRKGKSKHDALIESIRVNMNPVFVTSLTTCIGLMTMNFSSVPPLRDFGNMTMMGVLAAYLYSMTLLPALISILPVRVRPRAGEESMGRLADFVILRRRPLLWGFIAATVLFGVFAMRNEFRNDWINWFDESTEFRQDIAFMREHLSGVNAIEFSIPSGEPSGIANPEYLTRLDAFAGWLRAQPEVDQVSTLTDIIKRLNKNMHGDDPAYYAIPENRELAAQYLLLYEMSLPYGQDLNNQINLDKSASRVQVITDNMDSVDNNEFRERCEQWWRDHAPEKMWTHGTGNGVMFASIATTTIRSMVFGTPIALLFVSLTLIVAFRSLKIGLLSVIPNLVPLILAYGLWGLVVGRVNFGVACVAGLSIGIVVDDTVHFLSKYLRARREHALNAEDAVRYAFNSVGRAMWITSLILILGFSILGLSVFRFNSYMGMLTAITIAFALIADLFFLPCVLMVLDRGPGSEKTTSG
ncbi:MAG: MMPL family transporter [Candidatus Hydrogenedentes bacterium]|nr:MMPL family transporter [Candidatus Hydrogenedentota bacterium]